MNEDIKTTNLIRESVFYLEEIGDHGDTIFNVILFALLRTSVDIWLLTSCPPGLLTSVM